MKKAAAKKTAKKKPAKHHDNADIQKLAKRIKALRMEQGYDNYEIFAYEKEISRSQYGRYEQGEDVRFSSLMKLIRAFGLTPKEFFSEGFD